VLDTSPKINDRVQALLAEQLAYADELRKGGEQLREAARRYGYTEDEISRSFAIYQRDNPPPTGTYMQLRRDSIYTLTPTDTNRLLTHWLALIQNLPQQTW